MWKIAAALILAGLAIMPASAQDRKFVEDQIAGGKVTCPAPPAQSFPLEYPPASIRAKEEGRVALGVCTRPDGSVESVDILTPAVTRLTGATALRTCRRTFEPARDASGRAVRDCGRVVEFTWRLNDFPDVVWNLAHRPDPVDMPVPIDEGWSQTPPKAPPDELASLTKGPLPVYKDAPE